MKIILQQTFIDQCLIHALFPKKKINKKKKNLKYYN